jgi:hypothetical protein
MDEELHELRRSLNATRSVVKASMRSLRTCSQFLAALDERLEALENAQPQEAQRNGYDRHTTSAARH